MARRPDTRPSGMSILLAGGRVIDPGTGFDSPADVLIDAGRVAAVGEDLHGDGVIDVSGLIVGPGFVDLHSHVHSIAGQRLQALDGVTTSLDLEAGLMPVEDAYRQAASEGRPLHYGFSASWASARGEVLAGVHPDAELVKSMSLLANERWQSSSSAEQLDAWLGLLRAEIEQGALGVGILVGYAPRSDPAEYLAVARLAAEAGVPTWTHVRELVESDPQTPVDGSSEVVNAASETGAHMHHCHVNSTSRRHVDRVLKTISDAQKAGSRVTVEAYPYGAGSTAVGAAFLAPERLQSWGVRPSNLVLLPSGERIADEKRLRQVREEAPATPCIVEFLDEEDLGDRDLLLRSLSFPGSIVASDAMPVFWPDGRHESTDWPLPDGGTTHPRTSGTFCKTLRTMVRETGQWTWLEAFRRCSWLPARTLDFAPAAPAKGHLGVGADADIVVLDPEEVTDLATYMDPTRPSHGVRHSFVAGDAVVREGELVTDAFPGRGLRAQPR
jgi:N-acyl-D-aspartate/D-glutamate deacylase